MIAQSATNVPLELADNRSWFGIALASGPIFGSESNGDSDSSMPTIPDVTGLSAFKAARAYADAGLYVLPVATGKHPGSIVGKGWQHKSTRDPDVIEARWDHDDSPGIAIHTGRSKLVAFDLDTDVLPDELAWLQSGLFQATRTGESARGHYVFATSETFIAGKLSLADGTQVGEIRSGNSVIMAEPSAHPKAASGGRYRWTDSGPIPTLPESARRYLTTRAGEGSVTAADDDQVAAFIAATAKSDDRPKALAALVGAVSRKREGTHDCVRNTLRIAAGESRIGFYPFARASAEIESAARQSYAKRGESYDEHIGATDYRRLVANGVGWAMDRDLTELRAEASRDYGDKRARNAELVGGLKFTTDSADGLRVDEREFWDSSQALRDLRQFAQARRVGPAAMLGNSLARVVAAIPPTVVLPPTIGSFASLNLFVALVGRSGQSKSASMGSSADWLTVEPSYSPAKPGSGEGLAKCFAGVRKMPPANGNPGMFTQIGKQWSVLAQLPEVDTLTATGGRGGSTIMSELRSAWSGERLGLDYATEDKRIVLQQNRYRLCLVLGVQPLRAAPLFDDADGGTPQRFVWFSALDTEAPQSRPDEPPRLILPRWADARDNGLTDPDVALASALAIAAEPSEYRVLTIPLAAHDAVDSNHLAVLRGDPSADPLDGHRLLVRLKLAAALMALECRYDEITEADWDRAGVVVALSDATRQSVRNELATKAAEANVSRGRAEGERADVADQTKTDRAVMRVGENIAKKLADGGALARNDLRKMLPSRDRPHFDDAETWLIGSQRITKSPADSAGGSVGYVLSLVSEASK